MTGKLALTLLGQAEVRLAGEPMIGFYSSKAQALLFYLAVTGQSHTRPVLAGLLWADMPEADALTNLRQVLTNLRKVVGDHLIITRQTVAFKQESDYWLDVAAFQAGLPSPPNPLSQIGSGGGQSEAMGGGEGLGVPADKPDIEPLRQAVGLYRGDFLAGFYVRDAPLFEEWLLAQRAWLREMALNALQKLTAHFARQGDYDNGIVYCRRLLALEPWHEETHRQLMLLLARSGQRSAAWAQYETCRQVLAEELGLEPSPETITLVERIQTAETAPRPTLPVQPTAFIGRQREVAEIQALLLDQADCRLLTLVGPGGIGKTRLALAAALQTFETFPQEIYFVSLAPVGEVGDIVSAIAETLHFTFYGSADPKEQLLDYLSQKTLLLVVDNFEHLLDGARLLSDILSHAPNVTLLATSRERLNLWEEWVYEVQGLPFPTVGGQTPKVLRSTPERSEVGETFEVLDTYSAVELFLQRARQAKAGFSPSPEEMADIGRVCQLVEGMPLGLELAAPWIKILSCQEIAEEIERSLDFLTTSLRNIPERHRSLRVVFEQTWGRLSAAEQAVLSRLSVFRGGCTREAAAQITGATLLVLAALVDKALLRRTNTDRYELHELVRQFAEVQLQTDPATVEEVQKRHRDYFVDFLEVRTAEVKGARQKETIGEIKADMDNVRLAWRRAVANRDTEVIERAAECLFVFYLYNSGHYEGQAAFQQAAMVFIEDSGTLGGDGLPDDLVILDQQENLTSFLLAGQGYFLGRTVDFNTGQKLLERALALLRHSENDDPHKEAFILLWLGWIIYLSGGTLGETYSEPILTILAETGDRWAEGWTLLLKANNLSETQPLTAEEIYKRGIAICRESGDHSNLSYTYQMRSGVNMNLGQYTPARQYIDEAIRASEVVDNILALAYALLRRGELEIVQGKYNQAIQTLQQAETNFDEVRTESNIIWAQGVRGKAYRLNGDYEQAEQTYQRVLKASRNYKWHFARCLLGLGCVAYDQGDLQRAEAYQREALALFQDDRSKIMVADTLCCLGQVMVASADHHLEEARQFFRQALDLTIEHQLAPTALDVCVGVAQLLTQTEEVERAVELLALAEQHEASTFETKGRARQLLAELESQLPSEAAQAAQAQGRRLDWQTATRRLIEVL